MRTLYVKQKIFSLRDSYKILDENQNLIYEAKKPYFTVRDRFKLYDLEGNELFHVRENYWHFFKRKWKIFRDDRQVGLIVKPFAFFSSHKFNIETEIGNFTVRGNFYAHEFEIYKEEEIVASFRKKWLTWGDTYEITLDEDELMDFYLMLVIVIDNALHDNKSHGNH